MGYWGGIGRALMSHASPLYQCRNGHGIFDLSSGLKIVPLAYDPFVDDPWKMAQKRQLSYLVISRKIK